MGKTYTADSFKTTEGIDLVDYVGQLNFIKSNESLTLAQRKGDVLYGILDQFTGEELTLSKITGTPTVDNIIFFNLGTEYFKRNFYGSAKIAWCGAKGDGVADESLLINAFLISLGQSAVVEFPKGLIYKQKNSIVPLRYQSFIGNGSTLFRDAESKTTLNGVYLNTANSITVAAIPSDWKIGDQLHLLKGNAKADSTDQKFITSISGNTIGLNTTLGNYFDGSNTYNQTTIVRKVYIQVAGEQYPTPSQNKWSTMRFDGNRSNNNSNYYWYFNACLHNYGFGAVVSKCRFDNIPNENIICHGARIVNNTGNYLNGSFVHLSSPPAELGETYQGNVTSGNTILNTNAINPTITGHSLAVIEQSWNSGRNIVANNVFTSENKLGYCFEISTQVPDDGTDYNDEAIITGNIFQGYQRLSNNVMANQSWKMIRTIVTNNSFKDCGTVDYAILHKKDKVFKNNHISGDTVISNWKNYDETISYDTRYNIDRDTKEVVAVEATAGTKIFYQNGAGVGYSTFDSVANTLAFGLDVLRSGTKKILAFDSILNSTPTVLELNSAYTPSLVNTGFEAISTLANTPTVKRYYLG
jgi:hypothetical protein